MTTETACGIDGCPHQGRHHHHDSSKQLELEIDGKLSPKEAILRGLECHGFELLEHGFGDIPCETYVFNLYLPVHLTDVKSIQEMQELLKGLRNGRS